MTWRSRFAGSQAPAWEPAEERKAAEEKEAGVRAGSGQVPYPTIKCPVAHHVEQASSR